MKELSKFEIAAIKRTAQNVNSMVTKKNKLREKLDTMQAEYDQLVDAQEQFEAPIRKITGGYSTEDLVTKVVEDSGKLDKDGKPIKITKFVLKYPDTILPPEPENLTSEEVKPLVEEVNEEVPFMGYTTVIEENIEEVKE